MATRIAILVDRSELSETAARYALAAGPGEYDSVHLIGPVEKRNLEQLAAGRPWVRTAVLKGAEPETLTSYLRRNHINVLQMTTNQRIWRVRVDQGRVRGVDSQAILTRQRAA
jgi:hypothetical protein